MNIIGGLGHQWRHQEYETMPAASSYGSSFKYNGYLNGRPRAVISIFHQYNQDLELVILSTHAFRNRVRSIGR